MPEIKITIENCDNISKGVISLEEEKLNIRYGKEQFKAARKYWSKKEQIKMPGEQYGRCAGRNPQL